MPTHWHFVLWPNEDEDMTRFLRWLTHTHTQRWHAHYHRTGTGHVYQGHDSSRFRCRRTIIFTRCALRGTQRAVGESGYACGGLALVEPDHRQQGSGDALCRLLHAGPLPLPADWLEFVNEPETEAELEALRRSVNRGQPFGTEVWQMRMAKELNLESIRFASRADPRRNRKTGIIQETVRVPFYSMDAV